MKRLTLILAMLASCAVSCEKYDDEIAELQRRIDALATANSKVNDNVTALGQLVDALQNNAEVTSFSQIKEGGKVVGYTVTFREEGKPAQSVTVYDSPANVAVGELDGKYYWMVGGKWLTDDAGNKIEACNSPVVPEFRLTNGTIEVSLDGGVTWKGVGEVGTPVIDNVIDSETEVTFVMSGGGSITLQKEQELKLILSSASYTMAAGGSRTVTYSISGGSVDANVIVYAKDGWKATVTPTDATKGNIKIDAPDCACESQVLVFVSDSGRSVVEAISVVSTL